MSSIEPAISSIRIHQIHRIPIAVGIRTDVVVLLPHRIRYEPAGEGRAVLPCPEVCVGDGEVRTLVLLAGELIDARDGETVRTAVGSGRTPSRVSYLRADRKGVDERELRYFTVTNNLSSITLIFLLVLYVTPSILIHWPFNSNTFFSLFPYNIVTL